MGAIIINAYTDIKLEKSSAEGFINLSRAYALSSFQDFENYLRIKGDLNEDDVQLFSKQYNSYFVTYAIPPGDYSNKDFPEVVYTKRNRPGALKLENDDISIKTKLNLKQFSGNFVTLGTLRFDEKSFFKYINMFETILGLETLSHIH